jgi:hypothetical protein
VPVLSHRTFELLHAHLPGRLLGGLLASLGRVLRNVRGRIATTHPCGPNSRLRRRPSMLGHNRCSKLCNDSMPHRLRSDGMGRLGDVYSAVLFGHFPTLTVHD